MHVQNGLLFFFYLFLLLQRVTDEVSVPENSVLSTLLDISHIYMVYPFERIQLLCFTCTQQRIHLKGAFADNFF